MHQPPMTLIRQKLIFPFGYHPKRHDIQTCIITCSATLRVMNFKVTDWKRLWMIVLITLAFGIPFVLRLHTPFEWLIWAFWLIWLTLCFTSITLFWFKRPVLAVLGLVSALLSSVYACMPVLAK